MERDYVWLIFYSLALHAALSRDAPLHSHQAADWARSTADEAMTHLPGTITEGWQRDTKPPVASTAVAPATVDAQPPVPADFGGVDAREEPGEPNLGG